MAPPNSEVELVNVEFIISTLAIESKNRIPPFLIEFIFVNLEFEIVISYLYFKFSSTTPFAPIAPAVLFEVKLVNLELLIVALEVEAYIAVE